MTPTEAWQIMKVTTNVDHVTETNGHSVTTELRPVTNPFEAFRQLTDEQLEALLHQICAEELRRHAQRRQSPQEDQPCADH